MAQIRVNDQPVEQLPLDLYIPPDAMAVLLHQFEGPLDLLLYLIRKQNLDLLDIDIVAITDQYIEYVELMQSQNMDLAADYLVMSATLMEMKSRLLLPSFSDDDEPDEVDNRALLLQRLLEYEQFKQVAQSLELQPRLGRDHYMSPEQPISHENQRAPLPDVEADSLWQAWVQVLEREVHHQDHQVMHEGLQVSDRMAEIMQRLAQRDELDFRELYQAKEGREGKVVSFLAMMELSKAHSIEILQNQVFGAITIKAVLHG